MKKLLLLFIILSTNSYAGFFSKDYVCHDLDKARAEYDQDKYNEILEASIDEANPRIYSLFGGEKKFKSKVDGGHPVIKAGLYDVATSVRGVTPLCDEEYGYTGDTLLSDIFVDMFNGKRAKIRKRILEEEKRELEKRENTFENAKREIRVQLEASLREKCFNSIKVSHNHARHGGSFTETKPVSTDGFSGSVSVTVLCESIEEVVEEVDRINSKIQLDLEEKERNKKLKREAEIAVASCKGALKNSSDLTNPYGVRDFFVKRDCPLVIPSYFEEYKSKLISKYEGRALQKTIKEWVNAEYYKLSDNAGQFYNWLSLHSK